MDYIEADLLPAVCQACSEPDCWECDHAGERWAPTPESRVKLIELTKRAAIRRAKRQARRALTTAPAP